jgi:hypothetical protein
MILEGALAFFTFSYDGSQIACTVISAQGTHSTPARSLRRKAGRRKKDEVTTASSAAVDVMENRVIIVEKDQYHGMAAAPMELGWPGYAVVFETSGHTLDISRSNKLLAPFAPAYSDPSNGDPEYYLKKLFPLCASKL